jgi:hypothetical protein
MAKITRAERAEAKRLADELAAIKDGPVMRVELSFDPAPVAPGQRVRLAFDASPTEPGDVAPAGNPLPPGAPSPAHTDHDDRAPAAPARRKPTSPLAWRSQRSRDGESTTADLMRRWDSNGF